MQKTPCNMKISYLYTESKYHILAFKKIHFFWTRVYTAADNSNKRTPFNGISIIFIEENAYGMTSA